MNGPDRPRQAPADPAAGSRAFGPSFGYLVIALLLVAGGIVYWLTLPDTEPAPATQGVAPKPAGPGATPAAQLAGDPASATPAPTQAQAALGAARPEPREADGDLTPDLRAYLNPGENPSMAEVISRLHQAGVYTGIGAFSPPGTSPPLVGLAVPEDFVLPEGYVRHYQTTDDGQSIEPILMYAPDRPIFDAAGRPMAPPANRVVPPELAPPGLPLRRIVIPEPVPADKSGN